MRLSLKSPRDLSAWHQWFAWRPVRVQGQLVWLETIERKVRHFTYDNEVEYRLGSS